MPQEDQKRHPRATAKEIREARAYQIYEAHPDWGYRKVAKTLREEFGGALRDSELAKIRTSQPWYTPASELRRQKEASAAYYFTQNPDISLAEVRRKLREEYGHSTSDLRRIKQGSSMTISMIETLSEFRRKQTIRKEEQERVAYALAHMPKPPGGTMPEVTKELYLARAGTLAREGFFRWEWSWLAYHMISSPGMQKMREGRQSWVRRLLAQKIPWDEIERRVIKEYERLGLTFLDGRLNPFALLEWYKKKDEPTPDTPQKKRRVARKDFIEGKKNSKGRGRK